MDRFLPPLIGEMKIEFGAQPKKMSWGQHKAQSPLDDTDVLSHKQDDHNRKRKEPTK